MAIRSAPSARISRCSGARRLATSIASRIAGTTITRPFRSSAVRAIAARGAPASAASSAAGRASATPASVVTHQLVASSSCSAWAIMSAAIRAGEALPSAMIRTSVGPAIMSIPTWPTTCRFASATQRFPGPTILSTLGTVAVPKASAATAWAPPMRKMRVTPERAQAASTRSVTPCGRHHRHDLLHARHQRGHRVHHHRGRVRRLPARHVEADPVQRSHLHPDHAAVVPREAESLLPLVLVVLPHPVHRPRERGAEPGVHPVQRPLPPGGIELPLRGGEIHPVEPPGILPDGIVAPEEHVVEDPGDGLPGGGVASGPLRKQGVQRLEGRHRDPADHPAISR